MLKSILFEFSRQHVVPSTSNFVTYELITILSSKMSGFYLLFIHSIHDLFI